MSEVIAELSNNTCSAIPSVHTEVTLGGTLGAPHRLSH